MDDIELRSLLGGYISDSVGYEENTELNAEQLENLRFYLGEPFGNEQEGRSQVISRDVMDVVEWMTPALMKMFHGSDMAVSFDPAGPDDEEKAEQATDYVNYVYTRDNEGFRVTQDALKDGLIQKLGVAKYWWDESRETKLEQYEGLNPAQMLEVTQPENEDDEIEVLEQESEEQDLPDGTKMPVYDLKLRRLTTKRKVSVMGIAPEYFLISRRARSIEDAYFIAHWTRPTRSDLISQGYDKETVEGLSADNDTPWQQMEIERFEDQNPTTQPTDRDQSEQIVNVYECYVKVDYDGDGVAELRKIVVAGRNCAVTLSNEEIDYKPFVAWSPITIPHSLYGLAEADIVKDMQLIKSTLWRQMFDGLYIMNNPRYEVVADQVNLDDALNSRPGGLVRVKSQGSITKLEGGWDGAQAFPMLSYLDQVIEGRTGVSRTAQGTNPDLLNNQTATAVNQAMSAAQQRLELVARNFAEQFMKPLFKGVLRLLAKHQDRARMIRLRNKWVEVDPRSWNVDMDVTINVGLGTGNKDQKLAHLMQILGIQTQAIQAGSSLADEKNVYNTLKEITKAVDLTSVDPYFTDPQNAQPKPPKPDPHMAEVQGKLQLQAQTAQADQQMQQQKMAADAQASQADGQIKIQLAREQMAQEAALKREQMAEEFSLKREQMSAEFTLKREQMQLEALVKQNIAQHQAQNVGGAIRPGGEVG